MTATWRGSQYPRRRSQKNHPTAAALRQLRSPADRTAQRRTASAHSAAGSRAKRSARASHIRAVVRGASRASVRTWVIPIADSSAVLSGFAAFSERDYAAIMSDSAEPGGGEPPVPNRPRFDIEHYVRPPEEEQPAEASTGPKRNLMQRLGHLLLHLLDDRKPSDYSSISPRLPDGSHAKPFNFNGNGQSR